MLIPEAEIAFLHRLQELGDDNVYLGGSLLMAMMGIRRNVKDIDIILNQPTPEQQALLKGYGGRLLDFLLYRQKDPPQKHLRYRGIPFDDFGSLVRFKAHRAVRKDYLDLFLILRWLIDCKPKGVDVESSVRTIIEEVVSGGDGFTPYNKPVK